MGIDMTPDSNNPNLAEDTPYMMVIDRSPEEPKDHVVYDRTDGHAKWLFDTSTNTFQALHLPFYFANAPQCIKTELIEHIRKIAQEIYPNDAPLPTEVRRYRDSPKVKALRSAAKTGQSSLEAWE